MSPKRHQSQTERDLEGLQARRDRERARDQVDDLADAIDESVDIGGGDTPVEDVDDEEDITRPIEVDGATPMTPYEDQLWKRIDRLKERQSKRARTWANRLAAAMGAKPPAERLAALETRVKILIAILAALAMIALGSAFTTAQLLYERGVSAGELEQRVHGNEQRLDRVERSLFDSRHGFRDAEPPAFLQPRISP